MLLGAAVWIYSTDFKLLAAAKDPEYRPLEDDEEFSIMQRHVLHGMDIVRRSKWLADALQTLKPGKTEEPSMITG